MKSYDVVTVGSAVKDIMFYSDQLKVIKIKNKPGLEKLLAVEYGTKVPIEDVFVNYGGGAMNVAVGLKNFGLNAAPMVNVGRDQVAREMIAYLKEEGVDTNLMNFDKDQKTGFSIIISGAKDREHTVFTYKGANNHLTVKNLSNFRTKWFYVSALSNGNWQDELMKILDRVKRRVKVAWNPGAIQLQRPRTMLNFLPIIEVLILNKDEAISLVSAVCPEVKKKQLGDSKLLLKKIKGFGPNNVIITQGASGVMAMDEQQNLHYLPAKSAGLKVVDTVGAGDAFASGFMAGFISWNKFDKALALGIRNSAKVLTQIGAQNGLMKIKL